MSSQTVTPTSVSPISSGTRCSSAPARSSGPRRRRRSSAGSACGRPPSPRRPRRPRTRCRGRGRSAARRRARRSRAWRARSRRATPRRRARSRAQQQVLGRVAGDGELGEEDEVGAARFASSSRSRISARFPSRSPTIVLICASASLIGFRLSVENPAAISASDSGFSSDERSPGSSPSAVARTARRTIFAERVFGSAPPRRCARA